MIEDKIEGEVLFIGNDYGFPAGWSEVCKNLFENLNSSILKKSYALFSYRSVLKKPPVPFRASLFSNNSRLKILFLLFDLFICLFLMRRKKISVIHCLAEPYIPLSFFLSKIYGARLVLTIYGTYAISPYFGYLRQIYKKAFEYASHISSISNFTANKFREIWGNHENLEVVHLGANKDAFKENTQKHKEKFFLFVGTIKQRKGLLPALDAFSLLLRKYPDYKFLIVSEKGFGASSSSSYTKKIEKISNEFKGRIIFTGKITHEELVDLYQRATANVLVSISEKTVFEGFGLIHVEANLCGCISIGGTGSPNEEIIEEGKNGFLANGRDSSSILAAYENAISRIKSETTKKIVKECRKHGEQFDWSNFVNWSIKSYSSK